MERASFSPCLSAGRAETSLAQSAATRYHHDHLGSVEYMTDNTAGRITSHITYDDWGVPSTKSTLRIGVRDLDLVTQYTVHRYDQVLGLYFAQARMYDAADRRFTAVDWAGSNITIGQGLS